MSTYKLGPGVPTGVTPPMFRRPLICEQCLEALGNVSSVAHHKGMSAYMVAAMWPDMKQAVERHEQRCAGAD